MSDTDSTPTTLTELNFTVSGRVARPRAEVYEAVADPATLSKYFTTGGAVGRLEAGRSVQWDFADFPGAFPVTVVAAEAPSRIEIRWAGEATADGADGADRADGAGDTTVVFEFEPVDDDTRTLVKITERSWQATEAGTRAAFGNCEGWTGMLAALKAWVEHGINLREGFYR
ncbi:MAG: SRPBCC domain-containing protein [Leucobacter sp.]